MKKSLFVWLLVFGAVGMVQGAGAGGDLAGIQAQLGRSEFNYANMDEALAQTGELLRLVEGFRGRTRGRLGEQRPYLEVTLNWTADQVARFIRALETDRREMERIQALQRQEDILAQEERKVLRTMMDLSQINQVKAIITGEPIPAAAGAAEVDPGEAAAVQAVAEAEEAEAVGMVEALEAAEAAERAEALGVVAAAPAGPPPGPPAVAPSFARRHKEIGVGVGLAALVVAAGVLYKKAPQWMKDRVKGILHEHGLSLNDATPAEQDLLIAASYARFAPGPAAEYLFTREAGKMPRGQEISSKIWPVLYHVYYGKERPTRDQKVKLRRMFEKARKEAAQ